MTDIRKFKIKSVHSLDTEYCSDSIEWCPHEPTQNVFVCANYQLREDTCPEGITTVLYTVV